MDSIKAYEDLKAKAEAARLKAVEELETKKTALMGQVAEIDAQLSTLGLSVEPTKQQREPKTDGAGKGAGKGAMTEEKRQKLSEAQKRKWAERKESEAK